MELNVWNHTTSLLPQGKIIFFYEIRWENQAGGYNKTALHLYSSLEFCGRSYAAQHRVKVSRETRLGVSRRLKSCITLKGATRGHDLESFLSLRGCFLPLSCSLCHFRARFTTVHIKTRFYRITKEKKGMILDTQLHRRLGIGWVEVKFSLRRPKYYFKLFN